MEYNKNILLECDLKSDPISQFNSWYDEAFVNDPDFSNTMMLSTVGNDLRPSARVVLLKEVKDGGIILY